jgi:hypothetical protein
MQLAEDLQATEADGYLNRFSTSNREEPDSLNDQ